MSSSHRTSLIGLLLSVVVLSPPAFAQGNQDENTKYIQKVAPRVRLTVEKMTKARVNPTTPHVGKTFSSFTMRVDDQGRLLLNVELAEFTDRSITKLMQMGADTVDSFPRHNVLHAWVPFHKVRPIANQKEVLKIINIRPITEDRSKWPREWKITTNQLLVLAASIEEAAFSDESLDFSRFSTEELPVDEKGRIKVNLAFTTFNAELVAKLRALGCVAPDTISQILRDMKIIEGVLIPYDRLIDVARIDNIVAIRRPTFATVRPGFFHTQGNQDEDTKYIQKVAPRVRMTVEKMIKEGVNPTTPDVGKTFSSFRQRVDDEGRLLVYLELSEFSDRVFHKLMQMGLSDTNQVFPEFKALHGCIPFHKIRPIANQKEVLKIINSRPVGVADDNSKWPKEWVITIVQVLEVIEAIEESLFVRGSVDFRQFSTELVPVDKEGKVWVNLGFSEFTPHLLDSLRALGCAVQDTLHEIELDEKFIEGVGIPFDRLLDVARLGLITDISAATLATVESGAFVTEGDSVLRSSDVRRFARFDGNETRIGVISNGVGNISATPAGELPTDLTVIKDSPTGIEGQAMLQIIHDIVPRSKLFFATGVDALGIDNFLQFLDSIDKLIDEGCEVIVDDMTYLTQEPVFEDIRFRRFIGPRVQQGLTFVTSAGNYANKHYEGDFASGGQRTFPRVFDPEVQQNISLTLNDLHLFNGADAQLAVVDPESTLIVALQWNDRWHWDEESTTDYDLYAFNSRFDTLRGRSTRNQVSAIFWTSPVEYVPYRNSTGRIDTVKVIINRRTGTEARRLALYYKVRGPSARLLNSLVPDGSIHGHHGAENAISVGASPYHDPSSIEPFSSQGPVRLFFDPETGDRVTGEPITRRKPDVLAVDQVQTSLGPPFAPFGGTSAAAPHVAAIAAMVKQAFPHLTAAEIKDRIQRAGDRFDETQPNSGHSNVFGFGLVDARKAVSSPLFIVEGINGGSDHLLKTKPERGNPRQEVAGLVLTAPLKPKVAYLDTLVFSIPRGQQGHFKLASFGRNPKTTQFAGPGEIESFSLWWDRNRNSVADDADTLLGTRPFGEEVVFDTLRFKFDSTGTALLLTAAISENADTTKTICVELPDTNSVIAFFFVRALNKNFPFTRRQGPKQGELVSTL